MLITDNQSQVGQMIPVSGVETPLAIVHVYYTGIKLDEGAPRIAEKRMHGGRVIRSCPAHRWLRPALALQRPFPCLVYFVHEPHVRSCQAGRKSNGKTPGNTRNFQNKTFPK